MKFLYQKAQRRLKKRYPLIDKGGYRNTVFLAGTGRSGTTWVAQILNYKNDYRVLFEPFHSKKVNMLSHFKYRQYLRPDNLDSAFLDPVRDILCGRIRNKWIDKANRRIISNKRLIKDIRANHLLYWIKNHFPAIPIIVLLRHPCAVAASKIKLNFGTHLEEFLEQPTLMDDFLNPFKKEIQKAQDPFDKHIFLWCIENYLPLKQFNSQQLNIVFYENLCVQPKQEIENLFVFLKQPYDERVYKTITIPSGTTRKDSAIYSNENPEASYKKNITHQ
ncbi:MAG: sulfotransferase [Planctomycetota bacterium]